MLSTESWYALVLFLSLITGTKRRNMKKLMIIAIMCSLSVGAFAQKLDRGRNFRRSHVVLSIGAYAPYYPYYGYYSPFYRPFDYPYYHRETRLELKIDDINNDYKDQIWSARHDKMVSHKQGRQKLNELKHERDQAIIRAKRDYYKRGGTTGTNSKM
jgi:hypothetical protein